MPAQHPKRQAYSELAFDCRFEPLHHFGPLEQPQLIAERLLEAFCEDQPAPTCGSFGISGRPHTFQVMTATECLEHTRSCRAVALSRFLRQCQ